MTKKFLGIFKREKSGFSNEELEWQAKIGKRLKNTLFAILMIGEAIILSLLFTDLCNFFLEIRLNNIIAAILLMVFWIVSIIIGSVIDVVILGRIKLKEIDAQLQKNLKQKEKEEKEEKILSCLEEGDFLKLGIDWSMIDRFFLLGLIHGIIEIIPSSDGVEVSISKGIQEIPSFSIKRDELSDYFDVDD